MLPDKDIGCHETGFAKTCFECVTQHRCQKWQPLRVEVDRQSGQAVTERWGCVDAHAHTLLINLLGRQETTTASVDNLRKEVAQANDVGMGSALSGINSQLRSMARQDPAQIAFGLAPRQLTGNN